MKDVLVTGSAGFLGRALTSRLAARGDRVHLLVRPTSDVSRLSKLRGRLRVHRSDGGVTSLQALVSRVKPVSIFHLAAETDGDLDALAEANLLLGARLADAAKDAGVRTFVAAGTYWQRRASRFPDPTDLYAVFKHCQEEVLRWYGRATPLRTATVVLYDIYGPDDPRGKVLSLLADAARAGRPIDLTPGKQSLELVFLDDAVSALLKAERNLLRSPELSATTWYAPSARPVTLRQAVAALERVVGPVPARWGARKYRPRETMRPWRGPVVPGWRPRVGLERGLRLSFGKKP